MTFSFMQILHKIYKYREKSQFILLKSIKKKSQHCFKTIQDKRKSPTF